MFKSFWKKKTVLANLLRCCADWMCDRIRGLLFLHSWTRCIEVKSAAARGNTGAG